mgnify:CR=1 FL=1
MSVCMKVMSHFKRAKVDAIILAFGQVGESNTEQIKVLSCCHCLRSIVETTPKGKVYSVYCRCVWRSSRFHNIDYPAPPKEYTEINQS